MLRNCLCVCTVPSTLHIVRRTVYTVRRIVYGVRRTLYAPLYIFVTMLNCFRFECKAKAKIRKHLNTQIPKTHILHKTLYTYSIRRNPVSSFIRLCRPYIGAWCNLPLPPLTCFPSPTTLQMFQKRDTGDMIVCHCLSYYLDDECKLDGINLAIPQVSSCLVT